MIASMRARMTRGDLAVALWLSLAAWVIVLAVVGGVIALAW